MNKVKELNTTTELVKDILEKHPDARNSDNLLYCYVLAIIGHKTGIKYESMPIEIILPNLKIYGLPSIETVGRCRRKIVEAYPELAGNNTVEAGRILNEEAFKNYARKIKGV